MESKEEKARHYLMMMKEAFNSIPIPSNYKIETYLTYMHTLSSLAFGVYMAEEINDVVTEKELTK